LLRRFILPILAEYSDSGHREPQDKVTYSLRQNAQYHVMVFGAGFLGLIYVFFSYGIDLFSLKSIIMALAYCWGLVLAIYLMGHGLVSIPRSLFRNASVSGRLRRLQARAPRLYEQMEDSLLALEDIEVQVSELGRRKVGSARDFSEWIDELVEMANLPEAQPRAGPRGVSVESRILPTVITEKYMADLTRNLVRARHARSRYVNEWLRLVKEAAETQAILDSVASRKLEFGEPNPHGGFWDRLTILNPYTRYLLHYHVASYARIALGGFLSLASACIVWSEVVKSAFPSVSAIRFSVVHHWVGEKGQVGFAGQLIAAFWILYMCAAALTSMTEVKVWRGRALVRRNTAHESAFWYASYVARLSVPLSYNFMTFLSEDIYTKTVFFKFLGQSITLTALGTWFDILFPIFILVPVLATLFGLYGKVKRFFGFGLDIIDDDEEENQTGYGTGSWREGRDLIERELNGNNSSHRRDEARARLAAANQAGRSSAPVLSIPAAPGAGSSSSPARSPVRPAAGSRRPPRTARSAPVVDEPEDENFFSILGHRMKNSIDTFEAPKWIQDMGNGIKKPKWMGGDEEGSGPSGTQNDTDFRRWFGGSNEEGRIRL
jgi:hypothetical protein